MFSFCQRGSRFLNYFILTTVKIAHDLTSTYCFKGSLNIIPFYKNKIIYQTEINIRYNIPAISLVKDKV